MSLKDRSTLLSEIATYVLDNTSNDISAEDVRTRLEDIVGSFPNLIDDTHLLSLREYDPTKTYTAGFSAIYNNETYVCTSTTTGTFDPTKWDKLQGVYTLIATVDYTDIQTAGLTNSITAYTLPAGYEIKDVWRRVTTAFAGTGITTLTNELGISTDSNKYGFSQDLLATGFESSSNKDIESDSATTDILLDVTAVGANLDQLTQGELKIYATITKVF